MNNAETKTSSFAREYWLDLVRVLAIVMVVFVHSVDNVFYFTGEALSKVSTQAKILACAGQVFGCIGVPLFLLITGYLMLDRDFKDADDVISFWKKRVPPLIYAHLIWVVAYELIAVLWRGDNFNLGTFVRRIFWLDATSYSHLWYFSMIVGMYLAIPFVSIVVKRVPLKIMIIPMLISLFASFILPQYDLLYKYFGLKQLSFVMNKSVLGGIFGMYMVMGYYIKTAVLPAIREKNAKPKAMAWTTVILLICFALTTYFRVFIYNVRDDYAFLQYSFPTLCIMGSCIFVIIALLFENVGSLKLMTKLANASFGVYVIHYFILEVVMKVCMKIFRMSGIEIRKTALTVLYFVITFIVSNGFILIFQRFAPRVSKIIFLNDGRTK